MIFNILLNFPNPEKYSQYGILRTAVLGNSPGIQTHVSHKKACKSTNLSFKKQAPKFFFDFTGLMPILMRWKQYIGQ